MNTRFSLEKILQGILQTVRRFPLVVTVALAGTITGLVLIHNQESTILPNLLFTLILGFPLFIAATLFSEQQKSSQVKIGTFITVTIFLGLYLVSLTTNLFHQQTFNHIQYALWLAGAFVLVTFIPFIQRITDNSLNFWQYNQKIFYAFSATAIYSATIYIGLSIALFSVDFLFNLNIDETRWFELWVIIVGIFGTTFFLSRFPHVRALEQNTAYPKELKIFAYFVLAPLVCIYFLILYSYTAKIVFTGEWPKGVVSSMVLGFSCLGIFTYALLYPLIQKEQRFNKLSNIFFGILLPQIAVLFWAVWLRVSDYGITEMRYLLIVFGLWLLGISLYFIISKAKNIHVIALSLCFVVVGTSFGPWGIFSVSESSQIHRLETLLERNGILVNGKVHKIDGGVSFEDQKEVSEILKYLNDNHGLEGIQPWFNEDLRKFKLVRCDSENEYTRECLNYISVMELLGINHIDQSKTLESVRFYTDIHDYARENIKVSGYDYVINDLNDVAVDGHQYSFKLTSNPLQYSVYKDEIIIATISLQELYDRLFAKYEQSGINKFSTEEMSMTYEDNNLKTKIYFSSISNNKNNAWIDEIILVTFK